MSDPATYRLIASVDLATGVVSVTVTFPLELPETEALRIAAAVNEHLGEHLGAVVRSASRASRAHLN